MRMLTRAERWLIVRGHANYALRELIKAGPPDEPRDEAGRWTDDGGGDADKPASGEPELNPTVINVGGDQWNKATAKRLEKQYQEARPALDKLAKDSVGAEMEVPGDEEEDEPPYVPESWDEMSDAMQQEAGEKYKEQELSSYLESEKNNWYDSGNALDDAKVITADKYNDGERDWAQEAVDDVIAEHAEGDKPIPFTSEQILDAITLGYEPGYEGNGDLHVDFDDKQLQQPAGFDPAQQTLPGIEPIEPATLLTDAVRDEITKAINKAFDSKSQDVSSSLDPPDYLEDSAKEMVEMDWDDNMSDKSKFAWTKDNTSIIEDNSTEGSQAAPDYIRVDALPKHFDPLNQTSGDDYRNTQALARYLSVERAKQVIKDRLGDDVSTADLAKADAALWSGWKASSTAPAGKLLQLAAADELDGRLNTERLGMDRKAIEDSANSEYSAIGGYAGVKAYMRAKWETTQYLLDKAGVHDLQLYRGVRLDKDMLDKFFRQIPVNVNGYVHLPNLHVARNGAASTTTDPEVANDWVSGDARGVVLRASVPRTAALSVPAYGINVHKEREVVVAGTAWKGWDAWRGKAPNFERAPLQQAA
jgi:hypothetical protein